MIRRPLKSSEAWAYVPPYQPNQENQLRKISVRNKAISQRGWRSINGKDYYFKSQWEYRYALYLEFLRLHESILSWEYEPKTFWFKSIKRGCNNYKPDFRIIEKDNTHFWVEVKGYMDAKSKTKIKRFKKYFPEEKLLLIDAKWFRVNNKKLSGLIKNWI